MKRQRNSSQLKEQEKNPEKINNETEINNLPGKIFKALVIPMLTELGKRKEQHNENFNKELENNKETQSEIKNSTGEIKKKKH